jgi:molybdate transport system regulatory protein
MNSEERLKNMKKKSNQPDIEQALGYEHADKRLDILRKISKAGSISEAARESGVSYKAAWQALETLSNLAGVPLIQTAVGGIRGGGAQLTEAGLKLLQGAELFARAKSDALQKLKESPINDINKTGLASLEFRTSMRNHLTCKVKAIKKLGSVAKILLDIGNNQQIESQITSTSLQLLNLQIGQQILALFKATGVQIIDKLPSKNSAKVNVLEGVVAKKTKTGKDTETSIKLEGNQLIVGFANFNSSIKQGMRCYALVDGSSVVIAIP